LLARVANTRHATMVNIWGTNEFPPKHTPLRGSDMKNLTIASRGDE
jgi:hypothetical protein